MTVPRFWRNINQRYNIKGTECKTCGTAYFPPRKLCPECRRAGEIEEKDFEGVGEVVSFTKVHDPGEDYDGTPPYILALVELDEGARLTTEIVDGEEIEIGTRVEGCFRKIGEEGESGMLHYGTKFRPVQ